MISGAQPIADFRDRGIERAGELYLPAEEALALVSRCDEAGLAVVGAEGVAVRGERLEARLDLIADASGLEATTWKTFREESNRFVRSFLNASAGEEQVVFNLIILSEEDWEGDASHAHKSSAY